MVAKESRLIEEMENKAYLSASDMQRFRISGKSFHTQFCRTQQAAETIAAALNSQLAQRLAADDVSVPRITLLLECFVYHLLDTDKNGSWTYRKVLAEKRLDAAFEYKKWNKNAGFVDGQSRKKRKNMMLGFSGGGGAQGVCVYITAVPITKLFAREGREVEYMCYERRRAEACVN